MKNIENSFPHYVDLQLQEFEETVKEGDVLQYSFEKINPEIWFSQFSDVLQTSIGKRYLPVLRVSDGEFLFALGFKLPEWTDVKRIRANIRSLISAYLLGRKTLWFMSGSKGYGYERYNFFEWRRLREVFKSEVRKISRDGILAVGFVRQRQPYGEEYHSAMLKWFQRAGINLNKHNYYPFYFVYALLNGRTLPRIVINNRILIVSSHGEKAQQKILSRLEGMGAKSVDFYRISRTNAMKEHIDTAILPAQVDVILVAAGVGASQIIPQLSFYQTLVIDAGFCVDLLADPSLSGRRYFTDLRYL